MRKILWGVLFVVLLAFIGSIGNLGAKEISNTPLLLAQEDSGTTEEAKDETGETEENKETSDEEKSETEGKTYVCSKCGYTTEEPGDCPSCNIPLTEKTESTDTGSETSNDQTSSQSEGDTSSEE